MSGSGTPARRPSRSLLELLLPQAAGVPMQRLGRTLAQAALVGAAAGLAGVLFFLALEGVQSALLEGLAGARLLRAAGEGAADGGGGGDFRPWLLALLPAAGALLAGMLTRLAPEARGGGGDAMIHAFHHGSSAPPARVAWVKGLASVLTLGSGGSGGREGPTMQIGGALGTLVGRWLGLPLRERRLLLVAGVAAGITAVFRTPLGAALLAIEVLYRDDFESDALVPALLASVTSYAVVVSLHGEGTLFDVRQDFAFQPLHLPLYVLLAVLVAGLAALFRLALADARRRSAGLPLPDWARPAAGGLVTGLVAVALILAFGARGGTPGQALGILGGGYGAAQLAIDGGALLPGGWEGVALLLLLCAAKLVAASSTIGTGGSAGDFAPSLVLGGLLGGAFGRAAQLLLDDPTLPAGAFALVGMGTFYGGIAHVPVAALVMTCELAGSYDLLVPLMLAAGAAFVALRRVTLYEAQVETRADSPVHRRERGLALLAGRRVADVLVPRPWLRFRPDTPAAEILRRLPEAAGQDAFPVVGDEGRLAGVIASDVVRHFVQDRAAESVTIAADLAQPAFCLRLDEPLPEAAAAMLARGLREVPVLDAEGRLAGVLCDEDVFRAWMSRVEPARG